ncbi:fluoride efflux transporter CrcB [Bacteroidia bacterium]|nr:fluoride efflux transporter CrcB [Bacteroidia bacterium]MDB4107851.1 fluoride efflux transporter CrcB [Bacteroidia bacterium]MDB9883309.1 fluoride efflux transporter CrcB [Bacteroidia bacterium]
MNILLVFIGGGLGAAIRWFISSEVSSVGFPYGIVTVNLLGCFLIGIASVFLLNQPKLGLLFVTGFLGGFTTFSSFGLDAFGLLQIEQYKKFMSYVLTSNVLGILLVIGGHKLASMFVG